MKVQNFGKNSIHELLKNPKYCGRYEWIKTFLGAKTKKIVIEDAILSN